jgi:hypothetical protein
MMNGRGKGAMSDRDMKMMSKAAPKRAGKGATTDREMKMMKAEKRPMRRGQQRLMMRPEKDRNYDEMRNPDRNLKQGAPMPIRQNNGGEVIMRMKRDKRSGRKMER